MSAARATAMRLAVVERLERCELVAVLEDEIADPVDDRARAPTGVIFVHGPGVERGARGLDGAVDVLGVALGDVGEDVAGRRVVDVESLSGGGLHPVAADQHPPLRADELLGSGVNMHLCRHLSLSFRGPFQVRPSCVRVLA